jgi:hypothetical protein
VNRRGHSGRTDANQTRIVAALRKVGATVAITSQVGRGLPDLIVGFRGRTVLLEVKDGDRPPSGRELTEAEAYFIETWKGDPVRIVNNEQEALEAVLGAAK